MNVQDPKFFLRFFMEFAAVDGAQNCDKLIL